MTNQSSQASAGPAELITLAARHRRSLWSKIMHELRKAPPTAKFGLLMIFIYLFLGLFAPWLAPYGESEVVGAQYEPWGDQFLLGTDQIGRDMLSRLIYGARNSVSLAFITTTICFLLGSVVGILSAALGGWLDLALGRIVDILMAIPSLIFTLVLLSVFGTDLITLILVIAVFDATRVYRLSRAVAVDIVVMEFVEAARLQGEKLPWIMGREVLPNILAPLAAEFGLRFCFVFLTIAALSFLGLGIQPPLADWGSMVSENATLINYGDITPLLPAGAIALLTVAVNFVVDWFLHKTSGLRDV